MRKKIAASLLAFFCASCLFADEVVLKNGDHLTGEIQKLDGENLLLKTPYAGVVTIQWSAVTTLRSAKPLFAGLKNGETLHGTVSTNDKALAIENAEGQIAEAKDELRALRSNEEQRLYLRNLHPELYQLWTGNVDFSLSGETGVSDTASFSIGASASRITQRDKIVATFTSIFTRQGVTETPLITANARRGDINYSYDLTKHWFTFGEMDLEYDQLQGLNLRAAPQAGFGYHLYKNPNGYLDLGFGGAFNREYLTTDERSSAEAAFGNDFARKLWSRIDFHEKFVFFPNLTRRGQYRANLDVNGAINLRRWVALQFTISDRYLSNPLDTFKKNDLIYSTGLRFLLLAQ